ncbi:hypothetical protein [Streptomyces sp. S4.7]|uniref:hypothetical protein n=1 Tax=Streptomyces sp. S4.7 TaxID=2705439 RepID=UPI00193FCDD1|nr:hypothetical protein [Streptomyces sp. S4.7]
MASTAAYDEIADWYEHEFLGATEEGHADPLGLVDLIDDLLGEGTGPCLEIGCGTGIHAARVRALGRTPSAWTSRPGCRATPAAGCRWRVPTPRGCRSATDRCRRYSR